MSDFALLGAAGYIAPRHMKAIKDTGNCLVAACDPHDNVGIIDSHFPNARFFTEVERFDRHLEKLRRKDQGIDYLSICTPNYLHDAHVRLALRLKADAICEKPVVINPWNIDALEELQEEYGQTVYTVLQLRLLPSLAKLKQQLDSQRNREKVKVDLTYITRRGQWYDVSWKGSEQKSGGVSMNIGIHFFDLLIWLFGNVDQSTVTIRDRRKMAGTLEMEWASVNWFLSVDETDLPNQGVVEGKPAFRSLTVDGEELEFSTGFTDLHTRVYEEILAGRGFTLNDARPSIELVYDIRNQL